MKTKTSLVAAILAVACSATAAAPLRAQTREAEEAPAPFGPIAITIDGADALHDAIRDAIVAELAATPDAKAPRRVDVKVGTDMLDIRFTDVDGTTVGRKLDRPDDDGEMVELIGLMAGNLARDQVGALLAELESDDDEPATVAPTADDLAADAARSVEKAPPHRRPPRPQRRPSRPKAHVPRPDPEPPAFKPVFSPVQAALVSPVGIYFDSGERSFAIDVSALFGRSGGLSGVGIHGLGSHVLGDHLGVSVSGAWAYRGGDLRGASIAGLMHLASSPDVAGLELAGIANIDLLGDEPSTVSGVQLAGVVNTAGSTRGLQLSGAVNLSLPVTPPADSFAIDGVEASDAQPTFGAQLSGILNVGGQLLGAQIAGVTNVARDGGGLQLAGISNHAGDFSGLQHAGLLNTADHIQGVQLGLINVARKVSGAQIGIINIAEENDGAAIGVFNFARNGDIQVAAWTSLNSVANVGVKMRVGPMFVLPSAGYHPLAGRGFSGQLAMGGHIPVDPVFIEVLVGYGYEQAVENAVAPEVTTEGHQSARLVVQTGMQPSEYFGFFGGTGAHLDITQTAAEGSADITPELVAGILLL